MGRGSGQKTCAAPPRRRANHSTYRAEFVRVLKDLPADILPRNSGSVRSGRIPTLASTEFVQNQARGRWAEALIARALVDAGLVATPYGCDEDIVAGEEGFKEYYTAYQQELNAIGKRCDLLIFSPGSRGQLSNKLSEATIRDALQGLEVRSSAFHTATYYSRPKNQRSKRGFLSFTVKSGDIQAIARWVECYGVPHSYVQVFEDEIYAIETLEALRLLADPKKKGSWSIERNSRNQFKSTVHIDISEGTRVADILERPKKELEERIMSSGRVIDYVKYHGGHCALTPAGKAFFGVPTS